VRENRVWHRSFGLEGTIVEDVDLDNPELVVVRVRPEKRLTRRCGECRRKCPRYDNGAGRRQWRTVDVGLSRAVLEADAPRVSCPEHGVVVAHVPWARHGVGHTLVFDQTVAWFATQISKTAATEMLRIGWRTVGAIVERFWADCEKLQDRFAGVRRLGIDEVSYKRGQRYLTVVVDHDTGHLLWAAPGRDSATLQQFFDLLGPARCALITHVSADGAPYISTVVKDKCPNAVRCADPFHVVAWATDALDKLRRIIFRKAQQQSRRAAVSRMDQGSNPVTAAADEVDRVKALTGARLALLKNPEDLTENQHAKLQWIALTDPDLHRAYQLKEGLRLIFKLPLEQATDALDNWIHLARTSGIGLFATLSRQITRHRAGILAAIEHHMSNGRVESVNGKIRLITRIAFGFASPQALIALAMLRLGGHRPTLPGRG
jgi:transposase